MRKIYYKITKLVNLIKPFSSSFQFRVIAQDQAGIHTRNSSNQASVNVQVQRNRNAPRFEGTPYKKTIKQTQQAGATLLSVRTKDEDKTVSGLRVY